MKEGRQRLRRFLAGLLLASALSGCLLFRAADGDPGEQHALQVTLEKSYQGVKDGNIESVPLPADSAYVTAEICVENASGTDQTVQWHEVFITAGDQDAIFPTGLGYDQAEAFSWLLPLSEPLGVTHIDHKFYFFLIQNPELLRIPAGQSQGCKTSPQYTSLALLFLVREDLAGQQYTLHFVEQAIPFAAKKPLVLPAYLPWAVGLGLLLLFVMAMGVVLVAAIFVIRKRQAKAQASPLQEKS